MNWDTFWDAFWDAITGLVEMPRKLVLYGWTSLEKNLPNDSKIMMELLEELNEKYKSWACDVDYN